MDLFQKQRDLDEIYREELNKEELKKKFETKIKKYSAPFLINLEDSYTDANIKVMFVGKETNGWWGKLEDFIKYDDSIDMLKKRYEVELNGGTFLTKENKPSKRRVKEYNWDKSKFLLMYKKLRKEFNGLLWSELLKIDSGANSSSKNSIGIREIEEISVKIFKQELAILKPDFIIFGTSTGQGYDSVIKEIFKDYKTDKKFHIKY